MSSKRSQINVTFYLAFLNILAAFGVDSSLPAFDEIGPDIGLLDGSSQISLLITSYIIGAAIGQIICGPFADRFGRVPTLKFGLSLYMAGALGSLLSQNLLSILIFRLLWGLGSSFPASMKNTIARDLYSGDEMAKMMSKIMAVFLLGPIITPLISEVFLSFTSWRFVYSLGILLAGVGILWSIRFGETLPSANQRNLNWDTTSKAFRKIFSTRITTGYILAVTFGQGAFLIWLSSSQPIFDHVYGKANQFAVIFSILGIPTAIAFFASNSFISIFGAKRVAKFSIGFSFLLNTASLIVALLSDGVPNFWVWLALTGFSNIFLSLLTPIGISLALEPMGDLAGTASGVAGATSLGGAALLATIFSSQIKHTVTPLALGYLLCSIISLLLIFYAESNIEKNIDRAETETPR
jgi:DHA1 family bicyclomycin/chloramphenicol resistance-like MFS transporter